MAYRTIDPLRAVHGRNGGKRREPRKTLHPRVAVEPIVHIGLVLLEKINGMTPAAG